jgi:hypothetical protein
MRRNVYLRKHFFKLVRSGVDILQLWPKLVSGFQSVTGRQDRVLCLSLSEQELVRYPTLL